MRAFNPRPAGVFGRTRPAGGGDSAPCLTPERMVLERREKRQTKALNKTNFKNTKKFTLRGQRSGQGQVKGQNYRFPHYWLPSPTSAALIGAIHPERVQRLARLGPHLRCYAKVKVKVRSGQVTKGRLLDGVGATHVVWVILFIESYGGGVLI